MKGILRSAALGLLLFLMASLFAGCASLITVPDTAVGTGSGLTKAGSQATFAGSKATKAGSQATKTGSQATKTGSQATKAQTRAGKTQAPATTSGNATATGKTQAGKTSQLAEIVVQEDGYYTSKLEVAAFLYQFGKLPKNFITKNEAGKLGWVASKGNLWEVTDRKSIGGDRFGNFEGLLPKKQGRQYYECDIDYRGGRRGAKRIIFSDDGLIFYTDDHYASFERLD